MSSDERRDSLADQAAALALAANGAIKSPVTLGYDVPFGPILGAAAILLLSWIMDVGAEMREENELTV